MTAAERPPESESASLPSASTGFSAGGMNIPAPPLAMPTPRSQEMVAVRRSEIAALKRGVQRAFENPVESSFAWAAVWLGVAVAAGLSLIALTGVEDQHVKTWVLAAHWVAIVAGGFLALFCGYYGRKGRNNRTTWREDLITDLDDLDERAPTKFTDQESHEQAE